MKFGDAIEMVGEGHVDQRTHRGAGDGHGLSGQLFADSALATVRSLPARPDPLASLAAADGELAGLT